MRFLRHLLSTPSLLLVLSISLVGCNDTMSSKQGEDFKDGQSSSGGEVESEFDQTALITSVVNNVILPAIDNMSQSSDELVTSIVAYCADLTADADPQNTRSSAQASWSAAMSNWQKIEMMQVGPLTASDGLLRDTIYSWPIKNYCAVDQDVGHFANGEINGQPYDISRRTTNRKGLTTIEYLLFNNNLNHSCSKDSLAPSGWNEQTTQYRSVARCEFAAEVARDLKTNLADLKQQWVSDSDGYQTQFIAAGESNSVFTTPHKALNTITDAMFYLDSITKDKKIGAPIGLFDNSCANMACVDDVESNLADIGMTNVYHNLVAFRALFLGGADGNEQKTGFYDFLIAVDAGALANTMLTDIDAALTLIAQFDGSTNDAVMNDPESIQAIYIAIKKVTDSLKSLFITSLAFELPQTSAGDAD